MPTLHLLGTGAAVTDPTRTTTMLAVCDDKSTILIDCGGDVVQRLLSAGIDLESIEGLIITHEHPDHVSGFPLFMEKIWLAGRTKPLPVYGIQPALDQANRCLSAFHTDSWDLPEIIWNPVEHKPGAEVLRDDHWSIVASPGIHGVPVVGVRISSERTGACMAYSCDTEPCDTITDLSTGVDLLIHEASGRLKGHSTIEGAADVARKAGVRTLVLVHLPSEPTESELERARRIFPDTRCGFDLESMPFRR